MAALLPPRRPNTRSPYGPLSDASRLEVITWSCDTREENPYPRPSGGSSVVEHPVQDPEGRRFESCPPPLPITVMKRPDFAFVPKTASKTPVRNGRYWHTNLFWLGNFNNPYRHWSSECLSSSFEAFFSILHKRIVLLFRCAEVSRHLRLLLCARKGIY